MKQAVTRKLFSYWNDLRRERAAPERSEIDPAAIRGLLCDTFILEVDPARAYPIRVAGARIGALFLRELKGVSFLSLWREEELDGLASVIESVLDDPVPAVAGVTAAPFGREPLDLELLLLPLRHHGKTHARILGSLAPSALPGWFGLIEADPMRLASLRILHEPKLTELAGGFWAPMSFPMTALGGDAHERAAKPAAPLTVVQGGRETRS
jgi:hypothetical protein